MVKKKQIENLKTRLAARGWSLAKTGLKAGSLAAQQAIKTAFTAADKRDGAWAKYVLQQAQVLTQELGQLKGSAMKVGQLLSTYGEHFLPKEANQVLKSLQADSPSLAWPAVKKQMDKQLGADVLSELEIDTTPWASASIGQVHRARRKSDGQELAMKIQYPGVDGAIETDLKFLRTILSMGQWLPKGARFDAIFDEVREMLYREVDYRNEIAATQLMADKLNNEPRYRVAQVFSRYSNQRLITTEFLAGDPVDGQSVQNLSLERRNRLGLAFLELYLRELFEFKLVQTDPHFGNYRVQIDPTSAGQDCLILFDFGAMREVPDDFLCNFAKVMKGGLLRDAALVEDGGRALNILLPDDPPELIRHYVELCFLITEPFAGGEYDWGASDLPKRVAKRGSEMVFSHSLRAPPQETVFLDRKLGGTFVFLSVLKCRLDARPMLLEFLEKFGH
ncbi:MAG: ABC1 kinase family protein [Bdellovibrionales bacterium]